MTTEQQQHRVEIHTHAGGWATRCSCGFTSDGWKTRRGAEADADDHILITSRLNAPDPLTADDKLTIAEALIDRARLFESYATPEWHTRAQQVRDLAQRFAAEVYGR